MVGEDALRSAQRPAVGAVVDVLVGEDPLGRSVPAIEREDVLRQLEADAFLEGVEALKRAPARPDLVETPNIVVQRSARCTIAA
jgi:hypothetical protein